MGVWNYCAINENKEISLHDCVPTQIAVDGGDLVFEFEDGFWIMQGNKQNPYGKTLRTGKSQLRITSFHIEDIYIHKIRRSFLGRGYQRKPQRREIELEALVEHINNGKWKLEFLYEYHGPWNGSVLFESWIRVVRRRFGIDYIDCQIKMEYGDMQYFWNEIREDRPW